MTDAVSLANLEMQLYGGQNYGSAAPSMYNNYMGRSSYSYPAYNSAYSSGSYPAFGNYNTAQLGQSISSGASQQPQQQSAASSIFDVLSDKDKKALTDCYVKTPSESVLGAAWGGVTFGLMNNPRLLAHPINTFNGFKGTDAIFKSVLTEGSSLNKLWTNPETNSVMRDAYCEMQRAFARGESKLGIFRKAYSKDTVNQLKDIMSDALKRAEGKSPEEAKKIVAEATAKLRSAYVTDGPLSWLAKPFVKFSNGSTAKTVADGLNDTKFIESGVKSAMENSATQSFKKAITSHTGLMGIVGFAAFEFLGGWGNIKKAFAKDKENKENGINTNYGMKQLGQTTIKGLGSGLGWGLGEGIGSWAFAKWGMKLGSKFHPVIGTVVGGLAGLVGASVGMMLMGRVTKAIVGTDVGEKISAQELTQTAEGQAQVLQNVIGKVQKGQASPEAQSALQKILVQAQQNA